MLPEGETPVPQLAGGVRAPHAVSNPLPQPHSLYVRSRCRVRTVTPNAMVNASLLRDPGGGNRVEAGFRHYRIGAVTKRIRFR